MPEKDGAARPQVTSGMVEAGLKVFLSFYPESGAGDEADRAMIALILRAGLSKAPKETRSSGERP